MNSGICIAHMFTSNLIKFLYIYDIYFRLHDFANNKGKSYLKAFETNYIYFKLL